MSPRSAGISFVFLFSVGCASAEDLPSEAVRPPVTEAGGAAVVEASGGSGGSGGAPLASGGSVSSTGGLAASTGGTVGSGGSSSTTGGAATGTGGTAGGSGGSAGAGTGGASGTTAAGGAAPFDAGPPGTVLFSDDFENGSAKWIAPLPGFSIVMDGSNVYSESVVENKVHIASAGDVAWTDQIVEARVKVLSFGGSSTSYLAGVFARVKDENDYYYAALQSDGQFKIKKKSGGNNSSISTGLKGLTVSENTWYTVRFSAIGSTLTLNVDTVPPQPAAVPPLTATDTDIASGGIAVGTTNATAEFDDVKVTVP